MNRPALLVGKELRAVAPLAAGCLAVMVAGTLMDGIWRGFALLAYLAGSMAIGASLVGHELGHSMLGPLLAQPVPRARVLAIKSTVGALALAVVAGAAFLLDVGSELRAPGFEAGAGFVLLVFAIALFVAPWLTMATRHAMAGTVGALVSPVLMALLLSLVGLFDEDDPGRFRWLAGAMVVLCGAAAILGWRLFTQRLEDLTGRGGQIQLGLIRRAGRRVGHDRSHPAGRLRQLLDKEARLQQLPVVLAGLYVTTCLLAWLTTGIGPVGLDPRQAHMTWLYAGTTALLVGAVASAEERQQGTLPWQLILPVTARRQFALKTVVALGLSVVLTGAIPGLLAMTAWGTDGIAAFSWTPSSAVATAGITLAGLYASSLSDSSVRGFVFALVLLVGLWAGFLIGQWLGRPAGPLLYDAIYPLSESLLDRLRAAELSRSAVARATISVSGALIVGLVAVAWRFALVNHSRAEDTRRRAWRQTTVLTVAVLVGSLSVSTLAAAVRYGPSPRGAVNGIVVDPDGVPVPNVLVRATRRLYVYQDHRLVPTRGGSLTDLGGRFRIENLPRGEYYPVALTGAFADADDPGRFGLTSVGGFAPTFFPGITDAIGAQTVQVDGRTGVDGLTIELVRAPTARVAGRLIDPSGSPVAQGLVSLNLSGSATLAAVSMSDADGRYAFDGVPPGSYVLYARPRGWPGDAVALSLAHRRELTVAGADISDLDLVLTARATVRGRVVFQGSGLRPAAGAMLVVGEQADVGTACGTASVREDGTFELEHLTGPCVLQFARPPFPTPQARRSDIETAAMFALESVRLDGRDITDTPLDLQGDEVVEGVEVVLTDQTARVTGSVRQEGEQWDRYPYVLVFPEDRGQWKFTSRTILTVVWRSDGTFGTPALQPGPYRVVAVAGDQAVQWQDPEILARLFPLATRVHLRAGETIELTLEVVR